MLEMPETPAVILASGSPRRKELLSRLLETFEVLVSGVPEPVDLALTPEANLLAIARAKAAAVVSTAGGRVVLAADTDVVLTGEILGKPADSAEAFAMLRRLRGREHEVMTAVVVIDSGSGRRWDGVVRSVVRIRNLSDSEIAAYVATGEPFDKAGGYAIQGGAASMVESVDGCYTNIVGLPLCLTRKLLALAGVPVGLADGCEHPSGQRMVTNST